jgi:hopene-associated glycosyltransferase HpnB
MILSLLALLGSSLWLIVLILPWRPWSTREFIDGKAMPIPPDLSDLSVLIPARNEAKEIVRTLRSIESQGKNLKIFVVDDQSSDGTGEIAQSLGIEALTIISGKKLEAGWAGKMWALEQGRKVVTTPYVLLLDADIELHEGILNALLTKLKQSGFDFVSIMASLQMKSFWEKLLTPAYIHFFKLLYPFALANSTHPSFAAAAGGCILTKTEVLDRIGGFSAIKGALIDDCSLAKVVKKSGYRTWIGLSHDVISHRDYSHLHEIWNLVARFAFTYLRYSSALLILCTILLVSCFWALPVSFVFQNHSPEIKIYLALGLFSMFFIYLPCVRFYRLSWAWIFLKPLAGSFYLLMTWSSAIRYWRGQRSEWKGRVYDKNLEASEVYKKAS